MTETMRAVVASAGPPRTLAVDRVTRPVPVGSELLVKVVAAGVSPADGADPVGASGGRLAAAGGPSAIPGEDFSGVVAWAPDHAHDISEGDDVFGMVPVARYQGSWAEYVCVPTLCVARKPAILSHAEAAGLPAAALTAWGMVAETARAHAGQRLLVVSDGGPAGSFAVQAARTLGAHVIACGPSWSRASLAASGADEILEPPDVPDRVVDVVIDVTDGRAAGPTLAALRPGGLLVRLARDRPGGSAETAAAAGLRVVPYRTEPDGAALATVARLVEGGDLRVAVGSVHPLEQVHDAVRTVREERAHGAVVLAVCAG